MNYLLVALAAGIGPTLVGLGCLLAIPLTVLGLYGVAWAVDEINLLRRKISRRLS